MKVLNTELYDQGYENLLKLLMSGFNAERKNLLVSPSDANVLVMAKENPDFQAILDQYYLNLPDGVPSVWVGKLKGAKNMSRCSGPDLFKDLIHLTKDQAVRHYFIGGHEPVLQQLIDVIKNQIGNPNIAGYYSPPFKEFSQEEVREMAEQCNQDKADIIWVGLGAPKQLIFSHQLAKFSNAYYIIPVGAAFDFLSGNVKKAPESLQKMGLEWAYRITQQPKRMFKRYFRIVPRFIYFNFMDMLLRR